MFVGGFSGSRAENTLNPGIGVGGYTGVIRQIVVAKPAAGAEWNFVLPGGSYWRLLIAATTLTTSGAAGARRPLVRIRDSDGNEYFRLASNGSFGAGLTVNVSYTYGFTSQIAGAENAVVNGVPNVILQPSWQIGSLTSAIDVGDQYAAVFMLIEEIDMGPRGADIGTHHPQELGQVYEHPPTGPRG